MVNVSPGTHWTFYKVVAYMTPLVITKHYVYLHSIYLCTEKFCTDNFKLVKTKECIIILKGKKVNNSVKKVHTVKSSVVASTGSPNLFEY